LTGRRVSLIAVARLSLFALVLFAVATAAATAAAPWLPPQSLSTSSLFVDTPDVVVAADGRALATWRWSGPRPAKGDAPGGWRMAVREPGALLFGPERTAPNFATALVPYGGDRVLALDTRARGSRDRISLRARFGNSKGEFGPPRTISTYTQSAGPPSLAGPNGSLAAWIANGSHGRRIVRAALESGGRFRHPFTLRARGRATDVVACTARGVKFVAWQRGRVAEARVKLAGRRHWGPVQRLGPAAAFATTFRVVGAGRRAYVAWLSDSAESGVLRVAVLPAAGTRFRKAQIVDKIDRVATTEPHGPAIVEIPERDALLAWTGWDGARWRVRAAVTTGGARFGAPFDVSPAGEQAVLGDVASVPLGTPLPAGTVMVVWSRLDAVGEVGDQVRAALRPPGGAFGPPEDVSDLDRARIPALAFDLTGRRWTTVWSQRIGPDQPGVPLAQITTFARSATRPG
jgi:hypothetical protein